MTGKTTNPSAWTYCADCLFWRVRRAGRMVCPSRKELADGLVDACCCLHPLLLDSQPYANRGDGCGDGVPL